MFTSVEPPGNSSAKPEQCSCAKHRSGVRRSLPGGPMRLQLHVFACATACLLLAGCSEPETKSATSTTVASQAAANCATDLVKCARGGSLGDLIPATPAPATGEPIKLGMINQENTPVGSFPELSGAVKAALAFINKDLGGIEGRPLELSVCNTNFSTEGSAACGQKFVEEKAPAVLGGIDVFGNGIDVLADNDIPFIGGIPVSSSSAQRENSFQWSGGSWGTTVAFADYATTTLKAKSVAILYGDFGPIGESAEYGKSVLEARGVQVQLIPYPIVAADLSGPIQAAAAANPDAMFLMGADTSCRSLIEGARNTGTKAALFSPGACAAPAITSQLAPEVISGVIFNVEGPISTDTSNPDSELYNAVVRAYGEGLDPVGAGTVSFRSMMNLYRILVGLGATNINAGSITTALRATENTTSFMGHDFTCDGKQFRGLPAMCSPQQILVEWNDGALRQIGDWIEVGEIYEG